MCLLWHGTASAAPIPHARPPPKQPHAPARPAVRQVYVLLRRMVDNIAGSDELRALKRYPTLKREIVTAAYRALGALGPWRWGSVGCELGLRQRLLCWGSWRLWPVHRSWVGFKLGLKVKLAPSLMPSPCDPTIPSACHFHPLAHSPHSAPPCPTLSREVQGRDAQDGGHHGGDGAQLHHRRVLPHHPDGPHAGWQGHVHAGR